MKIGVIAYGSLITDPGDELRELEIERRSGLRTPFRVEFARSSTGRSGAPTLVPVQTGGGYVDCVLLILRQGTTLELARDAVYRREIDKSGNVSIRYAPNPSNDNQVYVEVIPEWGGVDVALYTRINANIEGVSADALADLAIESARGSARSRRRDGITYLINAIGAGVRTPLTDGYARAVLNRTGAATLQQAWDALGGSIDPTLT